MDVIILIAICIVCAIAASRRDVPNEEQYLEDEEQSLEDKEQYLEDEEQSPENEYLRQVKRTLAERKKLVADIRRLDPANADRIIKYAERQRTAQQQGQARAKDSAKTWLRRLTPKIAEHLIDALLTLIKKLIMGC